MKTSLIHSLLLLLCITAFSQIAVAQTASPDSSIVIERGVIEGQVIDRDTQQEIISAKVEIVGNKKGTVTNAVGEFRLDRLAPNTYRLKVSATDYETTIRGDVRVGVSQSAKLVIELKFKATNADEVVVGAARIFEKKEDFRTSSNSLSQEEIRRAPGAVEDVSRMMQIMPGVTFGSDSRNDIIARGGNPTENFIMH
jgi:hypothetical protein